MTELLDLLISLEEEGVEHIFTDGERILFKASQKLSDKTLHNMYRLRATLLLYLKKIPSKYINYSEFAQI